MVVLLYSTDFGQWPTRAGEINEEDDAGRPSSRDLHKLRMG
jgi:hypothetical protein